jgi:hypothetical protein
MFYYFCQLRIAAATVPAALALLFKSEQKQRQSSWNTGGGDAKLTNKLKHVLRYLVGGIAWRHTIQQFLESFNVPKKTMYEIAGSGEPKHLIRFSGLRPALSFTR